MENNYAITCVDLFKNTGTPTCQIVAGFHKMHIFVPRGQSIATKELAETLATWIDLRKTTKSIRFLPFPPTDKRDITQNAPVYETLDQGSEDFLYVNVGKDVFYLPSELSIPEFNSNLQTLSGGVWDCYIVTSSGYILGMSKDGVKFLPFPCKVRVLPETKGTDSESAKINYSVRLDSAKDWNETGKAIKLVDGNPLTDITGLRDLDLSVIGTPTAIEVVVDVKSNLNAVGRTGAAVDDFEFLKDSDGSVQTPASMTPHATVEGRYTFVFVALETGTVGLISAATFSIDGYEGTDPAVITIP